MSKKFYNNLPWLLLGLTFLPLLLFGCATPQTDGEQSYRQAEEAYIDLKQNFTLVIPANWPLIKLPVSSPEYKADSVSWLIPGVNNTQNGTLQVKSFQQADPQEGMEIFLKVHPNIRQEKTIHLKHAAGPAFQFSGQRANVKVLYISIAGANKSHLLAFEISEKSFNTLLPEIKKIISSFTNLEK